MKKLLKLLIVSFVMFVGTAQVYAYPKASGNFYEGEFGQTGDGSLTNQFTITSGSKSAKLYISKNLSNGKCYLNNIPANTKDVGFKDYNGVSKGSGLKKIWVTTDVGVNEGHDYMAACYRTSLGAENAKFYFFGFGMSNTIRTDMYTGQTFSDRIKLCRNLSEARATAYAFAAETNKLGFNVKEKDFKYGYGNNSDHDRVTIGASWACNGKNTSGFNDCKGSIYSEAKFTNRESCPLYAGYKNLGDEDEYYYFSNKYDSQFTNKSYTHFCVAYDADLETRIKNVFKDYENKEIPNILDDYNNGKITFEKLTNTLKDKLNEMFVKVFDGEYLGSDMYIDKDNHLAYKEGTETNHCQDYSNYISDELIDISKILEIIDKNVKNAEEAEKLKGIAEGKTEEAKEEYLNSAMNFLKNGFTGPGIDPKDLTCEEMLGKNLTKILKFALEVLSIAGAIIAIVNSMISLIPALIAKDAEALKKAQSKCITMAIVLVLILLLPTLLTFMGNIFGYDLTCFNWMK